MVHTTTSTMHWTTPGDALDQYRIALSIVTLAIFVDLVLDDHGLVLVARPGSDKDRLLERRTVQHIAILMIDRPFAKCGVIEWNWWRWESE